MLRIFQNCALWRLCPAGHKRHTVAVRALEACPHARERVTPHMLALSTYLGHASVSGTFWYLQSTPQLMQDVAGAGEAWMAGDHR